MTNILIHTENLGKVYASGKNAIRALEGLNLDVRQGEIFGYLGPNGAGKTTTIRLLLDLIRPTEGRASIFSQPVGAGSLEIHRQIGYMPGELSLWRNLTGHQVVHYIASVRGDIASQKAEAKRIAERLDLDLTRRIRDYSTGNKRKVGLVLALMHKPALLILDEPTSGLDPLMQQTFNQMMREVRQEGRSVFLSSHMLSEVQAICDRVGILRDGRLRAIETVEALTHVDFRRVLLDLREPAPSSVIERLGSLEGVSELEASNARLMLKLQGDFDPLLRAINGIYIKDLRVEEPTLEEIFLTFYGDAHNHKER